MIQDLSQPRAAVRMSVTEKKRLLSEWQQSNLKMKVFCEQKQISVNALKNWIKQFDMGRKRKSKVNQPGSFVALIPERSTLSHKLCKSENRGITSIFLILKIYAQYYESRRLHIRRLFKTI